MASGNQLLRRSREHRIIAGVIGGFAEYFNRDPTLLRVLYVIISIASAAFPGILIYLLLWLIIPYRNNEDASQ